MNERFLLLFLLNKKKITLNTPDETEEEGVPGED